MTEELHFDISGGVGTITLNRPEAANALTVAMRDDLIDAIRTCRNDELVRCVLIKGTGASFCSGMDLRDSTVAQAGKADFDPRSTSQALRVGVQTFVSELWELDKPSVAAVQGHAIGPGAHLGLACDFVFVSDSTKFRWSFAKWGLVVDAGGAYLLPRLVGLPRARQLVLLGEGINGNQAVEEGLVHRHTQNDADALSSATELAASLAEGPTRSLGLSKQLLNKSFESTLADSLALEGHFQALATASSDMAEGMRAFAEKRPPDFTGH